jgi:PAS domain S-box-containing protein
LAVVGGARELKRGATDYVLKQNLDRLAPAVRRALAEARERASRRRAEAALRESERRLQTIFDNTQDAILLADDAARYVDVNPAACALMGYTRDEPLARTVWDLTPLPDRSMGDELWRTFIAEGRQGREYVLTRKDGTTVTVEYRAVANIQSGLHLSVLRDVSGQVAARGRAGALRRTGV